MTLDAPPDRPDVLEERLAAAAQARFGLSDAERRFLRRGQNSVYRLTATDGTPYALRIHPPGHGTDASVRSEMAWMESLRADGIPVPTPLPGIDGDVVQRVHAGGVSTVAVLISWAHGSPLADEDRPALWEELGTLMARVHEHGRRWTRPAWFERPAWDARALAGHPPRWGLAEELPEWTAGERALLLEARAELGRRLAALDRGPDRYGLIHGDLMFGNVLVDGAGDATLIDFDDSGDGWYAYELAVTLYPFEDDARLAERRDALVRGYRAVAPLDPAVLAELPTMLAARRLATLGWMVPRAETAHVRRHRAWRVTTTPASLRSFLAWSARTPVTE
jgi:Ser/Thr protein kinase RdoA (MazF antagonist)